MAQLFIREHAVSNATIVQAPSGDAGHEAFLVESNFGMSDLQALDAIGIATPVTGHR